MEEGRNPKAEGRPATLAPQRGENKPETRNSNQSKSPLAVKACGAAGSVSGVSGSTYCEAGRNLPLMEKKVARVLRKLRKVRGLSDDEKYLFARSLAATPDQRWQLHESFLRSHDLYTRSARRKYGFK